MFCTVCPEEDGEELRETEALCEPEEDREAEEFRTVEGVAETGGAARRLQRSRPSAEKTFL